MHKKIYLHQHLKFNEIIEVISEQKKIDPYLVEKDYWIMHCLYGLQKAGYSFQLKGGTSLSKGYKIINRFSEDIDIHIDPPMELKLKTGKNHNKDSHIKNRKNYFDQLANEIRIDDIEEERDIAFDDKRRYRSAGIRLKYKTLFANTANAKEGVLLEVGFDDISPNEPKDISSWAQDFAISRGLEVIDNKALGVACYNPEYTFVEKLQAIVTKYRNYLDGNSFPANFMRHYYDLYCLLKQKEVQFFMGTKEYNEHKKKRFPKIDFETPIRENQAFLLKDAEIFNKFEKEYKSKSSLYYQGQPDFKKLMRYIQVNIDKL